MRTHALLAAALALAVLRTGAHGQAGSWEGTHGHGVYEPLRARCLTDLDRRAIHEEIRANRALLVGAGVLPPLPLGVGVPGQRVATTFFAWPIRAVGAAALDPGVHGISNFVDAAMAMGTLQDYECGTRTYDGHRGVDIFSWPFPWNRMAADEIEVVAGAPGTIVSKQDGFPDQSCSTSGGQWNAVYVLQDDGSVAWYGHLKRNSLTARTVGQRVGYGDYLGVMGSSGNSTGPHLHLEVYNAFGQLVDPFEGPCRTKAAYPTWLEQPPYYDSAVNRLQVGDAPASLPPCPMLAVPNDVQMLAKGSLGYFTAFYRDQRQGQVSSYRIVRPNGTTLQNWNHSIAAPHFAASWWWWSWTIPAAGPNGTWRFEVDFQGQTYSIDFVVF